jgi:23S rRNA (guanine745-N1)-methyltransferase
VLEAILHVLRCPVCGGELGWVGEKSGLGCGRGHRFDVARQGYVGLTAGKGASATGDSAAMIAARERFLGEGHYDELARRIARVARGAGPGVVVDAGAGTGYYLARVVADGGVGVALDAAKAAVRRAARVHERVGAVLADVWRPLPLADDAADVLLNVFAPRNGAEFARVLKPGGMLLVVTPGAAHLSELVAALGLLSVDPDKDARVAGTLGRHFAPAAEHAVTMELSLSHAAAEAAVGMGPSAWHLDAETTRRKIAELPEPIRAHASFRLTTWMHAQ